MPGKTPDHPDPGSSTTGEDHVPKPPDQAELEQISEAQRYITDDWTGEPPAARRRDDAG